MGDIPIRGKAIVYTTKGKKEEKRRSPKYMGSYARRLPTIYVWGSEPDEDNTYGEWLLIIRGKGSANWARGKEILNERWDSFRSDSEEGATVRFEKEKGETFQRLKKEIRRDGYKNVVRFLEYEPTRMFFSRST